jgi:hypothetical protein
VVVTYLVLEGPLTVLISMVRTFLIYDGKNDCDTIRAFRTSTIRYMTFYHYIHYLFYYSRVVCKIWQCDGANWPCIKAEF